MVEFLNTAQARGEIEGILTKAKTNIVIISPFIKINDDLVSRLNDAGRRNVQITMVCREEDLRPEERTKIEETPNLELRFNERVHAKCFYNERCMVITSLNLYSSASGDNREMGVLLSNDIPEDRNALEDAKSEAQFIIRESSEARRIRNTSRKPSDKSTPSKKAKREGKSILDELSDFLGMGTSIKRADGFCLRCKATIPLNPDAPYCPSCYRIWAKYKDDEFEEKFCHLCGQPASTSRSKPLCSSCYKRTKNR